jgi:DNA-binding SARP family transcriptional activator
MKQAVLRILSTGAVFGLVVGVPLVLVGTRAVPPLTQLQNVIMHPAHIQLVLKGPFSDSEVTELVWTTAWLVWSWFILCLVVEILGRVRGRVPDKMPGSRHIQSAVTFLVGASLALGTPSRQASPLRLHVVGAPTSNQFQVHRVEALHVSQDGQTESVTGGPVTDDTAAVLFSASETPGRTYVVKPRDTLWSIAGEELGSPMGWRRIAAVNYGRRQPDGGTLVDDHWIRPGWVLVIPASDRTATVVGPGQSSALVVSAPKAVTSGIEAVPIPSSLPMTLSTPASVGARKTENNGTGRVDRPPPTGRAPAVRHSSAPPHVPIGPIGYGLLGAGVVALLDRMRRVQQRHRPTGLRIALPEGDLVELERGLRIAADTGSTDWIDLALRLLAVTVQRSQVETPSVLAVRLRDDAIEIVLDATSRSLPAPAPFESAPDGASWFLARSGQRLDMLSRDSEIVGIDAPLPSLVTLGRDESGIIMVNIERAGSLSVSGSETDLLVEAIAVELATAKWADQIDLVLVGFSGDNEVLERVSHARSLRAVSEKLKRRVRERAALLALADRASNTETRWLDGGDAWDLCVVVCTSSASKDELSALGSLVEVAGDGSLGVAVICGCDVNAARWRVRAHGGRVSVEGKGLGLPTLARQPVSPNFAESVAALVSVASQTAGVTPDDAPYESLSLRVPERERPVSFVAPEHVVRPSFASSAAIDPGEQTVTVRVLGPVEISGAARQFTRAWAVELVVYLAVHPGGVSNEQWATALWPDKAMAAASLHSTASAARRSLGTAKSGDDHLPRGRGRLGLGPDVRTDWDRLVDLSQSSQSDDWREALSLIRGRPFDGLRSPDWVVLEGILATVEAVIVDLACRYAERCLEAFDAPGAEWAARQGLRVSPYDERLYRVLLKAADAAGNPAGVESIMAELVHLVADEVEPFDAVHPETLALYRSLSRRSIASRGL